MLESACEVFVLHYVAPAEVGQDIATFLNSEVANISRRQVSLRIESIQRRLHYLLNAQLACSSGLQRRVDSPPRADSPLTEERNSSQGIFDPARNLLGGP